MKALFICHEEEEWPLLTNLFHAHFSSVKLKCVKKGAEALETLMFESDYSIVIIECSHKENEPTPLAEDIIETIGSRPILFVGNQAMIKDRVSQEFFDQHDMLSYYYKPYQPEKFVTAIEEALGWAKQQQFEEAVVELDPEQFLPLKLRNFYLYDQVPFDVYIELTKTKFLKAISANKKYHQAQIQDFAKRNIKYLYLEKNEHLNFLENSLEKITLSLNQIHNKDTVKRMQTLVAAVLVTHQYIKDVGVSDTLKEFVDLIIKNFGKIIDENTSLNKILLSFPFEHGDVAEQAVLKGILCEFMVRAMGWRSEATRAKTGLAAIIHDVFIDREEWAVITFKDHPHLDDITDEERESFLSHPKKAAETAQYFTQYPDVDFIVEQHHEQPDGSGFPRGINIGKITKISAIFIISNNFVIQTVINGLTQGTIKHIMQSFQGLYTIGNFKEPFNHLTEEIKRR